MNSVQESKNELDAAIRYAENAISSAKQTIESMEFRQEMAQKNYQEQTGREESLQNQLDDMRASAFEDAKTIEHLNKELQRQKDLGQGYYDSMMTFKQQLEEANKKAEFYTEAYTELEVANGKGVPTMPVIPKDVAIAIFRHGTLFGVEAACDEIQGESINISESGYTGDFEVSFERDIDLDDHIDFDWVRSKVGDYDEDNVTANLEGLCAKNNFECRIHGIDKQEEKKND